MINLHKASIRQEEEVLLCVGPRQNHSGTAAELCDTIKSVKAKAKQLASRLLSAWKDLAVGCYSCVPMLAVSPCRFPHKVVVCSYVGWPRYCHLQAL